MEFTKRLQEVFKENHIEILDYKGEKQPITYKCLDCGKIYSYNCARNLFSKITLCKDCYNPFTRWNKERIEKFKLQRLFPNSDLHLIRFNGINKSASIKCNKCGTIEDVNNLFAVLCKRQNSFCNHCEKK